MVAPVIPIRGVVRDLFACCAGVLVPTPVTLLNAPPVEPVQPLLDLTPAEAKIARSLVVGATVDEIAAGSNTSSNTVRIQVRGVLEKTGRRLAEVTPPLKGDRCSARVTTESGRPVGSDKPGKIGFSRMRHQS